MTEEEKEIAETGDVTEPEEAEEQHDAEEDETPPKPRFQSLWHNYISFAGIAISLAAFVSLSLLFLLEITGQSNQPYLGILIYILFPSVLIFGLFVIVVGMILERRRRRKLASDVIPEFPVIDLNDPRRRRSLLGLVVASFVFLFISAFGSYQAYEFTESVTFCGQVCHTVMGPEFLSYGATAHAQVKCVECHVGSGAEWYARSKFSGVRQLVKVSFGTYDRPIHTPVANMRPARETCAKCHWPEKFHGEKLRVFKYYGYDEENTLSVTKLLVRIGGGNPETGQASGIHWHMNLANEIEYAIVDDQHQTIPWVSQKGPDGKVTIYKDSRSTLSDEQIRRLPKKKMDCIDCHSRPAHKYLTPNNAVDSSLTAGKLDRSLPFVKRTAVDLLSKEYSTTDEAVKSIRDEFVKFYKTSHAETYSRKQDSVEMGARELQRVFRTYFFPEMKTDWRTHPDNIGHFNTQGCFRCHDGRHLSPEGKPIRSECNICHVTIEQSFRGGAPLSPVDGKFQHPIDLGNRGNNNCAACHKADRSFKHPVNLGDISRFDCVECHKTSNY